jgi:hypothetical protein
MNILVAQVDMLIVEIISDVIMSGLITRYYLNYKIKNEVEVIEETISPLNINEMFV